MDLSDYIIVPGVIINVKDPEKLGRVKCAAPGLFDPSTMPEEVLPWVNPFNMNKYQNFSKPVKNSKVWILHNKTNKYEFWYFNFFEYIDITKQTVTEKYGDSIEVLLSRKTLDGGAQITYDDKEGIIFKVNNAIVNIFPNGDIMANNGNGCMNIIGDKTYVGGIDSVQEKAVKGNTLSELIGKLANDCHELAKAASESNGAQPLAPWFQSMEGKLNEYQEKILSEHVFING